MLHRHTPEGLVIISQPAHAWISGQIARQWGNDSFEAPAEEVCFAAEQHDIGFLGWEQSPTLNPKTGLPHTFMEMPTPMHLDIWRTGIQQMARFGRYPALLVSMHFTSVVQQHGTSGRSPADQKLVNRFLTEQCQIQADWVASLRNRSNHQPDTAHIHRDQGLVSLWDWLSLLLCMGLTEQKLITGVSTLEPTKLTLTPLEPEHLRYRLNPWPFRTASVSLMCEGRLLPGTFIDEENMRAALKHAAPVSLSFELRR